MPDSLYSLNLLLKLSSNRYIKPLIGKNFTVLLKSGFMGLERIGNDEELWKNKIIKININKTLNKIGIITIS